MLIRFPRLRTLCISLRSGTLRHYRSIKEQCLQEHHEWYIVHVRRTEWMFSGVDRSTRGIVDLGCTRSPKPMNRAQALRYLRATQERAVIIHIDDRHKIITFSVSQ